ncbi:MAG: purine-binding chemotaxis protein CheW [Bacteroidales bacterium]|nr:purine-binding chemotaxis protein CheW [Bacteroidales bacterium]
MESVLNSFLIISLGKDIFAVNISNILCIVEPSEITEIPDSPNFIRGITNFSGVILPVLDLKTKMNLGSTEIVKNVCIVVFEKIGDNKEVKVGVLVDSVISVIEIKEDEIDRTPINGIYSQYINGTTFFDNQIIMIVDINAVFSKSELSVDQLV